MGMQDARCKMLLPLHSRNTCVFLISRSLLIFLVTSKLSPLAFQNRKLQSERRFVTFIDQSSFLAASKSVAFMSFLENAASPSNQIEWIIRPATFDDVNETARILRASYYALLPNDYDEETVSKALPSITRPQYELLTCGTWYVAEHPETGTIVGCGGWTQRRPGSSPTNTTSNDPPHLRHFATDPQLTRSGIGKAIWKRTWKDISDMVGPNTTLEVYSTLTAEPFYASLGFLRVGRVEIPLRECNFTSILMRREVPTIDKMH